MAPIMILYYAPISPRSRRVLAAAYHLGYEPELKAAAPDSPEIMKANPNGAVPVLVDGDFKLWESMSILMYLPEKKGDTPLWPRGDARARADISRWMNWSLAHFDPAAGPLT